MDISWEDVTGKYDHAESYNKWIRRGQRAIYYLNLEYEPLGQCSYPDRNPSRATQESINKGMEDQSLLM